MTTEELLSQVVAGEQEERGLAGGQEAPVLLAHAGWGRSAVPSTTRRSGTFR